MGFSWNDDKNELLKRDRGVSFERVVVAIEEGHLVDILEHPNRERYGNQKILVVDIEGYAFCVPMVTSEEGEYLLKTLFPSRKYTKKYKLGGTDAE